MEPQCLAIPEMYKSTVIKRWQPGRNGEVKFCDNKTWRINNRSAILLQLVIGYLMFGEKALYELYMLEVLTLK